MKIALITNKAPHHLYFVNELYKNFEVALVLHPIGVKQSLINKIKQKKPLYYGSTHLLMKMLSLFYGKISSKGLSKRILKAEKKYFSLERETFKKIPKDKIHEIDTVNSDYAISLIKKNKIDIICFLGGDIAKKEFINSAKLCLNYHNGVSPFYNGNKTNFHAVSDFRPNFTGGTLMKMNERIDGGEILMHFLCPIAEQDDAEDLYMKSIIGAVKLYSYFLDTSRLQIDGVKQKKSFKYVRNIDWNLLNDLRLKKFNEHERMKLYVREEKIIDYTQHKHSQVEFYGKVINEILG